VSLAAEAALTTADPDRGAPQRRTALLRTIALIVGAVLLGLFLALILPSMAHAATALPGTVVDPVPVVPTPTAPNVGDISIDINGPDGAPSTSVVVLVGITLLSIAPALLLMMSSFTKIFVVLAMTRNALGLPTIPPNQVLAGLALFLSLFIMWPVLNQVNVDAVQPFMSGSIDFNAAIHLAAGPLKTFMLAHTREEDIALMTRAANHANPASPDAVPMVTLIPSFMISELRAAFIIGLVIFVPFLIIDLVVASGLMAMGMMMLPPVMIALPFKILLFILVDGWGLIITALVQSYNGSG
jgi:flagellar biosynthetic protein FliP